MLKLRHKLTLEGTLHSRVEGFAIDNSIGIFLEILRVDR